MRLAVAAGVVLLVACGNASDHADAPPPRKPATAAGRVHDHSDHAYVPPPPYVPPPRKLATAAGSLCDRPYDPTGSPRTAWVRVESVPPGATLINEHYNVAGVTPLDTIISVCTGEIEYGVKLAGYEETTLVVPDDGTSPVKVVLTPLGAK